MWHNRETLDQAKTLAEEIAKHLDGYEAVITVVEGATSIELVKDGIFRLNFWQYYSDKGRMRIHGVLPKDPHGDVYGIKGGEITVSMNRSGKAIAGDITRRLLEEYEQTVEAAILKIAEGDKKRQAADALAEDLVKRIPGAVGWAKATARQSVHLPYRYSDTDKHKNMSGEIEVSSGGYYHVDIRTENADFLRELADLIAKHQG